MPSKYDFAVVDFPDPNNYSIGKLYTAAFYRLLARHITDGGAFVVQSTSPLFARRSFWSIVGNAQIGRPEHLSLSRVRAVVRRVGIRAGDAGAYTTPTDAAGQACAS